MSRWLVLVRPRISDLWKLNWAMISSKLQVRHGAFDTFDLRSSGPPLRSLLPLTLGFGEPVSRSVAAIAPVSIVHATTQSGRPAVQVVSCKRLARSLLPPLSLTASRLASGIPLLSAVEPGDAAGHCNDFHMQIHVVN